MTNPFATQAPAQAPAQTQQAPAAANPFTSPQAPQQPAGNPFATQQAPAAANPAPATVGSTPAAFALPQGADPFGLPRSGDICKIQDDVECAVLVRPTEHIAEMTTTQGKTDAVKADWIVLTGPNAGAVRTEGLIFNRVLKSTLLTTLRGPSEFCVGFLTLGKEVAGKSRAYILATPEQQHIDLARQAAAAKGWIRA